MAQLQLRVHQKDSIMDNKRTMVQPRRPQKRKRKLPTIRHKKE